MEAIVVVDYTNDFVADDGKVTAGKPAQAIEKRICEIVREWGKAGHYIVIANDIHYEDPMGYHPESRLFPPHNLAGTPGRDLYGGLEDALKEVQETLEKTWTIHRLNKTRYSAFAGTDLDLRLREREIKTIHILGICTDICVLHTAIDAYNLGYNIVIHADAVETFKPNGQEWALDHFKTVLGATIYGEKSDENR